MAKPQVIFHHGQKVKDPNREIKDLLKAYGAISLAFAIVLRGSITDTLQIKAVYGFLIALGISALTVGFGFILHELAHRTLARRYKCKAEFRSFDYMLVFAILLSFTGFVFAAPGAVFISGNVDKKKNGIISLSGPATNLILAVLFILPILLIKYVFGTSISAALFMILFYGFYINAFLGLFNLIPVANFDGKKIFAWSWLVWTGALVAGIAIFLLQFVI